MKKILFLFAVMMALTTPLSINSRDVDPSEDLNFPMETQVPPSDSDFPPFEDWFDFDEDDF